MRALLEAYSACWYHFNLPRALVGSAFYPRALLRRSREYLLIF
jgi:hypothetical protein